MISISELELPFTVKFTRMEIRTLKMLAVARGSHKGSWGQRFVSKSDMTSDELLSCRSHYLGLAGEYAAAKATGGFFDCLPRFLGDEDSSDIVVGDSQARIACKTTKYAPAYFKLTKMVICSIASQMVM